MDCNLDITRSSHYPIIYKINVESSPFQEILSIFVDEILQDCCYSSVESALVDYVTSIIEPVGWRAVWRSTKKTSPVGKEYDFVVEVVNVSLNKLEADVFIKSFIVSESDDIEKVKEYLKKCVTIPVPLIELYAISEDDDEEIYLKTAVAIENVRLFIFHIQRPWDSEDDVKYTEEVLKPRLQLYFDMKNNILPRSMVSKIKVILKQAAKIQKELSLLYSEMNVSDSEAEINEEDFMHTISLKEKLHELQTKMEMLENPVIRSFVEKKYALGPRRRQNSGCSKPVIYIVSKQFTVDMILNLHVNSNSLLEFEHNPEIAFKSSSVGDKIIIFPGVYQCDTLGWMEESIFVEGVGSSDDIILEATGNSDVFLNCCARNVELHNITLKAENKLLSAIVVHHGKLVLKNCIIDSNSADNGVLLLGGAEAVIENSTIRNSLENGILMKSLSSLNLTSSTIEMNKVHGIQIDAENEYSAESFTEFEIYDSKLTQNGLYGIYLNNVPITDISLQRPSDDFTILELFPWLKHKVENIVIENNGENGIGVSSTCKNNKEPNTKPQPLLKPEELNYSALSELLNAVNMSMELETQHLYNS